MGYIDDIKRIERVSTDDIISVSLANVPLPFKNCPWKNAGNHGVEPLQNETQLVCYMAAYGEMHKSKLSFALNNFKFSEINDETEIIDWGCGQGIASVMAIEKMRYYNLLSKLKRVTLVEPSDLAIERAKLNIECVGKGYEIEINKINKYLPTYNTTSDDVIFEPQYPICIHLFSNILDVEGLNLKMIAEMIGRNGYRHYIVCVGPLNATNRNIDAFASYFINEKNEFSRWSNNILGTTNSGKTYGGRGLNFYIKCEDGKPVLTPLAFYPPRQFFAAYRTDCVKQLEKEKASQWLPNKEIWKLRSAFDVLAPFDIGASIYDDSDPVMSVLNNIITRGLPTKRSPFVEKKINEVVGCAKEEDDEFGGVRFPLVSEEIATQCRDLIINVPVGVARVQKTIIEAVLTKRIDINAKRWSVLAKEDDVPCVALAFADLAEMYNHLVALIPNRCEKNFPEIKLTVLSEKYAKHPLQMEAVTNSVTTQSMRMKEYDMVLDISMERASDAKNVEFSEFKAKNKCYFNIRNTDKVKEERTVYTTDGIIYKQITEQNREGRHNDIEENVRHLEYFLKLIFRKKSFRAGQTPILNRALQKKDVIGLLPTGGGKSLTYQLAAMLQPGVTMVIDPLKSLMLDQYEGLLALDIDNCTYVNSSLKSAEKSDNCAKIETSRALIAFMSPERLCNYDFRRRLRNMHELGVYFSYGVVDEVHCVSEWGQDFRYTYLHLGRNLHTYVLGKNESPISLFGLTATASFDVLSDVERELATSGGFEADPGMIVRYENSNRLELQYKIEKVPVEFENDTNCIYKYEENSAVDISKPVFNKSYKSNYLKDLVKRIPSYINELQTDESLEQIEKNFAEREGLEIKAKDLKVEMPIDFYEKKEIYDVAGIVFCLHRKTTTLSVERNACELRKMCEVGTFVGSSDDEEAELEKESMLNLEKFRKNELPLMVATKAFGMGIDKPNVRFTVNMNYSSSLEAYIQEAGRAGRDRKMALSVILVSDYNLACVSPDYPEDFCNGFYIKQIKGKWYKSDVLDKLLELYNYMSLNPQESRQKKHRNKN